MVARHDSSQHRSQMAADGNSVFPNCLLALFPFFRNNGSASAPSQWEHRLQYFVVMIDYGRRGREPIVDPEITRREVISRVISGEYRNISFIHEIADCAVDDITAEILAKRRFPKSGRPARICRPTASITPAICANTRPCDLRAVGRRPGAAQQAIPCEPAMLQGCHIGKDCAAVPYTFAKGDQEHLACAVSYPGADVYRASAVNGEPHARLHPASRKPDGCNPLPRLPRHTSYVCARRRASLEHGEGRLHL